LEGTDITLTCSPTLFPEFVTLYWTHNGTNITDDIDGITFSPVDRNHNLMIEAPIGNQSGVYECIAAPAVRLSFDITVVESKEVHLHLFTAAYILFVLCLYILSLVLYFSYSTCGGALTITYIYMQA